MFEELGWSLESIRSNIDSALSELRKRVAVYKEVPAAPVAYLNSSAAPALIDLLARIPGVIGNSLSGDINRIESAKASMMLLKRRLVDAGIDLDDSFTQFPARLAELRAEFDARRNPK